MLGIGDVPVAALASLMRGDDLAVGDHIEGVADDAHVDAQPGEPVGHGVLDAVDLDVPVPMHLRGSPRHRLPALLGKIEQLVSFRLLEPVPAVARLTAERCPSVDDLHLRRDRVVQLVQRRERAVGQVVDHPVRDDLHPGFDVALVPWPGRAGRHRGGPVVLQELGIRDVHVAGPLGLADLVRRRGGVVRHDHQRDAADVLERPPVGIQPGRLFLIQTAEREHQPGVGQRGHKDRHRCGPAADRVGQLHPGARPVHLHRVPRHVRDRSRQVMRAHMLGDDLTEPVIPVEPCPRHVLPGRQVPRPQHLQRRLLAPHARSHHLVDIHRDELPRNGLPAVSEEPV